MLMLTGSLAIKITPYGKFTRNPNIGGAKTFKEIINEEDLISENMIGDTATNDNTAATTSQPSISDTTGVGKVLAQKISCFCNG